LLVGCIPRGLVHQQSLSESVKIHLEGTRDKMWKTSVRELFWL